MDALTGTERVARLLDERLSRPILVTGSLPAEGRDLDLLVGPKDRAALVGLVETLGLQRRGTEWFGELSTELVGAVVELVPAESLGLSGPELARTVDRARPIDGFRSLRRPSPDTTLLLLAHRLGATGRLDPRRRRRIDRVLAEDSSAWEQADKAAAAWSARASLRWLREAYEGEGTGSTGARLRALRERRADAARAFPGLGPRAVLRAVRPPRPALPIVALSGLDGSGKSTQARLLAAALEDAGLPSVVLWDRLGYSTLLRTLTAPLRLVLRVLPGASSQLAASADLSHLHDDPAGSFAVSDDHRAARGLREKLPWLTPIWATLVVLVNGVPLRRRSRRAASRGLVVVHDRYLLDSKVHLQARYGRAVVRPQVRLLRRLVPPPLAAFYLDVPPAVAYARKPEEHRVEALAMHRELYLQEAAREGVRVLDGRLPPHELAQLIAADVRERL